VTELRVYAPDDRQELGVLPVDDSARVDAKVARAIRAMEN